MLFRVATSKRNEIYKKKLKDANFIASDPLRTISIHNYKELEHIQKKTEALKS